MRHFICCFCLQLYSVTLAIGSTLKTAVRPLHRKRRNANRLAFSSTRVHLLLLPSPPRAPSTLPSLLIRQKGWLFLRSNLFLFLFLFPLLLLSFRSHSIPQRAKDWATLHSRHQGQWERQRTHTSFVTRMQLILLLPPSFFAAKKAGSVDSPSLECFNSRSSGDY